MKEQKTVSRQMIFTSFPLNRPENTDMTSDRPRSSQDPHFRRHTNAALATNIPASIFEEIARVAALVCQVPIAAVTFSDPNPRWMHSDIELSREEWMASEEALCSRIPVDHRGTEVTDTAAHARWFRKSLTFDSLGIRFYANAPILLATGHCIGVVSVAACEPRGLTDDQRLVLSGLAKVACACLLNPSALPRQCLARRRACFKC